MAPGISFQQSPNGVCYPPLDGSLFLPELVEFNARRNPTHPFYTFHDDRINGLRHISHLEFYRACQRVAYAIRPDWKGRDNMVIGILANCDTILYQALIMGIIYAGLIPFPMSPRNSPAGVLNMMRKTGCRSLMATRRSLGSLLDSISLEVPELEIEDPPTLAYAYPRLGKEFQIIPFVPYPKVEARPLEDSILFYLHSSGSTGFPKPVPITNITAVKWFLTPSFQDYVNLPKHITIGAASLPSFHMMGMLFYLFHPVASLKSIAVFSPTSYDDPSKAPIRPNAQNTLDALRVTKSTCVVVVPSFLEEWATSTEAISVLRSFEYVAFGGGALVKKIGDTLVSAGINLISGYGGTEFGPLTHVLRDPTERNLWEWVKFEPSQNIRWVSQGDGTYECQVLTTSTQQPSVENLPDIRGYATSDVFVKHPTTEGFYKIVGRIDDVLIHSSGEKTVPAPMETEIGASPMLSGVCMFGRDRVRAGVLVEPRPQYQIDVSNDKQVAKFRDQIWQEVEAANEEAPAFSRIFKEMILVTSKEKPMLRAGKGTVMKKATMNLYEAEIDALYASVEASARASFNIALPLTWSQTEIENWLIDHATAVNAGRPIVADIDMFEQGFDSLSSTSLRNRIISSFSKGGFQATADQLSPNVVFSYPTIRLLSKHLTQLLNGKEDSTPSSDPQAEIESMISKYSLALEHRIRDGIPGRFYNRHVILLTGSTGGLGSYLLASLLGHESVALVYAFNRPSNAGTTQQRQRAAFEDRGLDTALLDSNKLIYIEGDTSRPDLSLDEWTYAEIRDSVTVIIHNAWRLDFNLALSSFEPHVRGTRHLIDLARGSIWVTKPRFFLTSSIASAQGWEESGGAFPEEVQYDARVAVGPGYGASKYVSERILAMSGLTGTSFRIGQITGGGPGGAWSASDWVPIIIKSSVSLGALPEARGVVSWLPPHAVSSAILDVAFGTEEPPNVVNLVHPRPSTWASVMQSISKALYEKQLTPYHLPFVPFTEWVDRLETKAVVSDRESMEHTPAVKLIYFMRTLARGDAALRSRPSLQKGACNDVEVAGMPKFATGVARRVSETMCDLEPLSSVDAERWVDYWASVGMFAQGGIQTVCKMCFPGRKGPDYVYRKSSLCM